MLKSLSINLHLNFVTEGRYTGVSNGGNYPLLTNCKGGAV